MMIKAEVEYKLGEYEKALSTAESAFEIPGIKDKQLAIMKREKLSSL